MRRSLTALALALLVFSPLVGRAYAAEISLADFQARLSRAAVHLEAAGKVPPEQARTELDRALELAGTTWVVTAQAGQSTADMTGLAALIRVADPASETGRADLVSARALVQEHLEASRALEGLPPADWRDARSALERRLRAQQLKQTWSRILSDWLERLLARWGTEPEVATLWIWALVAGLAVAGLGLLVWGLRRSLLGQLSPGEVERSAGPGPEAARSLPPGELWNLARDLSGQGEHKEAIRLAHVALLRHLDRLGLVAYTEARTNREYERQLRRRFPALAERLRSLNARIEVRLYSGHRAAAEHFADVDRQVADLWEGGEEASKASHGTSGAS